MCLFKTAIKGLQLINVLLFAGCAPSLIFQFSGICPTGLPVFD
jgi:hypothetical protein